MNASASGRLPCGSELSELIDQVADNLPPADPEHQRSCPHCREVLQELNHLWGRVQELAREEVDAPYRIVQAVLQRVRSQGARPALPVPLEDVVPSLVRHALLQDEKGRTRVADSVIARIVSLTVRELPELDPVGGWAARGRSAGGGGASLTVTVTEERVVVNLRLIADYGIHLPSAASALRELILRRIAHMTGLVAVDVDILIDDVRLARG